MKYLLEGLKNLNVATCLFGISKVSSSRFALLTNIILFLDRIKLNRNVNCFRHFRVCLGNFTLFKASTFFSRICATDDDVWTFAILKKRKMKRTPTFQKSLSTASFQFYYRCLSGLPALLFGDFIGNKITKV